MASAGPAPDQGLSGQVRPRGPPTRPVLAIATFIGYREVPVNRPVHSRLTRREAQVLSELLRGTTTRQIATQYGIGHQTVKNYLTVIYEKLGIRGRSQLSEWHIGLGANGDDGGRVDL